MKTELTSNRKLDYIIECLNEASQKMHDDVKVHEGDGNRKDLKTSQEILQWLSKKELKINQQDLNLMLFHLANEKYILEDVKYYNYSPDNVPSFRILYSGKLFIENGGYIGKEKSDTDEKRDVKLKRILHYIYYSIATLGIIFAFFSKGCYSEKEHSNYHKCHER